MLIGDIAGRNAKRYPQKVGLISEGRSYTFKEFNGRVNRLAHALLDMGLEKGGRVAILAEGCPEYAEIYFALAKTGLVAVPLNYALGSKGISYMMGSTEARMLVFGSNYGEAVNSLRSVLGDVKYICLGTELPWAKGYEALLSSCLGVESEVVLGEGDLFIIAFTSGTTGSPKGVMLSHKNVLSNPVNFMAECGTGPDNVALLLVPTSWFTWFWYLLNYFYVGAKVVILREFEPKMVLKLIEREKVSDLFLTCDMLASLLECPGIEKYDLTSLRALMYGGGYIPQSLIEKIFRTLGKIVFQFYATTEAPSTACLRPSDHILEGPLRARTLSCGREVINMDVRILNKEGKDVPLGEIGELVVKGDSVMLGYWKEPKATANVIKGGFFHTGDMARVDEEGYIYVLGRKEEVISEGDEGIIFSREVEDMLCSHPAVKEAAVVKVAEKQLEEATEAFVALQQDIDVTGRELIEYCRLKGLSENAIPMRIIFIDRLPRTPSGKLLRRELLEKSGRDEYRGM